ncbi:hypothetical protein BGZ90_002978 [Linnemannia elongata]|nr:hypothetical protein BGZ90_002978 [Linnemannia elongata]
MPISPNTPQAPSAMESPSPAKPIKTPVRSLSRADSSHNQPHYDKDLPPTPTSSNHLAHPPLTSSVTATPTENGLHHHHHPTTTGLEPTPDNSALQLPPSTPSSSSSSSHSNSHSHPVTSPAATATPSNTTTPTTTAKGTADHPQSIALTPGTFEREDLLVSSPQQPSSSEDKERILSKRVTLMGPPPPYNGSGESPVALDQQQPQRHNYQQHDNRYQQYEHHQQQQQYQSHQHQHPESALILSQDNTPSSSRTTTTTLTTRTSTTPEPSNGLQLAHHVQDRNGHTSDDPALLPSNQHHHRSESMNQQNGHTDSHRDRNRDLTGKSHHQQEGQDGLAAQGGAPVDPNGEDPARVKPRRVLGNYHMSKTLGAGSMGKVKLGVHSRTRDKD